MKLPYSALPEPARSTRRVEALAVLLGAVLLGALLLAVLFYWQLSPPAPVSPAADSVVAQAIIARERLAAEPREGMMARPLFSQQRRPHAAEEADAEFEAESSQVADELKTVTVVGLFSDGQTQGMIVRFKQQRLRVKVGGEIAGWELLAVGDRQVSLGRDGRRSTLTLERVGAVLGKQ